MKKKNVFKKFISLAMAACILGSTVAFAQTESNTESSDSWNTDMIDETTINLYEDFPMQIDKNIGQDMRLDLHFSYLKILSDEDNVQFTMTDLSTDDIVVSEMITAEDTSVVMTDVPNNKQYSLVINENIGGTVSEYIGYITTKHVAANFPVDMTLGNYCISNNSGETFNNVKIKKVGDNPVCNHEEEESCTDSCKLSSYIDTLTGDELNTFYSTLDRDCYYEMQVRASTEGNEQTYVGFISTYDGGEYEGVFTRGFTFTKDYPQPEAISDYGISTAASLPDFSTAYSYEYYRTMEMPDIDTDTYLIRFVPPATGYYIIETIGNSDTMMTVYSLTSSGSYNTSIVRSGGTGENARTTRGVTVTDDFHPVWYFEVENESSDVSAAAFRIVPRDDLYPDDYTNNIYEVQENCDAGIYSNVTNTNCALDYAGDIDIFGYEMTSGNGYIIINNLKKIKATIYNVIDDTGYFDDTWVVSTINVPAYAGAEEQINFSSGTHYIEISNVELPKVGSTLEGYYTWESFPYDLDVYDARRKDAYDIAAHPTYGDASPQYATVITSFPFVDNFTLCRGDSDGFRFTTDAGGGNITITVNCDNFPDYEYIPRLYDMDDIITYDEIPPSWEFIGDELSPAILEEDYDMVITYNGLKPYHDYYIVVERPDSTSYDSYKTYSFRVDLEVTYNYSAILSDNLEISHTIGNTITVDDVLFAVMNKMTCKINDNEIEDSVAIENVKLYYNNTELTSDTISSLPAGEYTIVPKYNDVAASGGTVILVVSEPIDVVEVDIDTAQEPISEYDWLHCAKLLANFKLAKEGSPLCTLSLDDAAVYLGIDPDMPTRGTLFKTYQATCWFYTGGTATSSTDFNRVTNANVVTEDELYTMISNNRIVIMQLADSTAPTDVTKMKYLVICGVNKTNNQLKVFDCLETSNNLLKWVDTSVIFDGGYVASNSNIKFSGSIIEVVSN